jgi:flagellar protein FliS
VPASAYLDHQLELAVNAARPVELVVMLYDGAISAIKVAGHAIAAGDVNAKVAAVTKASNIIGGLSGALDMSQGPIAQDLFALYSYMQTQLLQANLRNSRERLEEVERLLDDLRGAWQTLAEQEREKLKRSAPENAAVAASAA